MFKATMKDPSLLKDSISTISKLIDEGMFKIKKDGIEMLATDRSVVAVADFKLLPTAFSSYKCDKKASLGLDLINFYQILRRVGSKDKLALSFDPNTDTFEVRIEGASVRKFTLPAIDVSSQDIPNIDKLTFTGEVEVDASLLKKGVEDAELVADAILLEASPGGLIMRAEGDSSSAQLKVEKGSKGLHKISISDTVSSRYSIEYLDKMLGAGKLSKKLTARVGQDFPLKLDFGIKDKMSLSFILAPRVE